MALTLVAPWQGGVLTPRLGACVRGLGVVAHRPSRHPPSPRSEPRSISNEARRTEMPSLGPSTRMTADEPPILRPKSYGRSSMFQIAESLARGAPTTQPTRRAGARGVSARPRRRRRTPPQSRRSRQPATRVGRATTLNSGSHRGSLQFLSECALRRGVPYPVPKQKSSTRRAAA